ncbi:hypothetical protein ANCDUO_09210 [Ancylostoma duodenale]|uniref:Uncharacterized protein n=1 Tax=Ancylostoma duodenale TaxID=51022 RepID=A0A0C2GH70_9BILA|nr:hypothetical protein ANCDUO_09210 [Ancylostoma duodenale]
MCFDSLRGTQKYQRRSRNDASETSLGPKKVENILRDAFDDLVKVYEKSETVFARQIVSIPRFHLRVFMRRQC